MPEQRQCLTIVTEKSVEKKLCKDLENLGAKGYTISDARGKGARGSRSGEWDYNTNIRLEVLCTNATAEKIRQHCEQAYFEHYAMIIYHHEVSVVRSEKF